MKNGIEIGIIGAGWWACANHLPALLSNRYVDGISVNRPDEVGLNTIIEKFPDCHAFADTQEMLEKRPLAGVIISSPHIWHARHAKLCIDLKIPVMIEKPMATNAQDAAEIVDLAARLNVPILISYGWNFSFIAKTACDIIRKGWIGDVRHISCTIATATADLFSGLQHSKTEGHLFRPPASTWATATEAGGFGWGQLSHALGLLFLLVDKAPTAAFARMNTSPANVDWYDAAVVVLENGANVVLSGAATVPDHCRKQLELRLFGTDGMLLIDFERARVEAHSKSWRSYFADLPPGAGSYECIKPVTRFVDICRGKKVYNPANGILGQRTVGVLDAMYRSSISGHMEAIEA